MTDSDVYMRRALTLAARGLFGAHPNPMVGAVIVAPDGRIIGEGWHRRCGEGHAEVNAMASVSAADRPLLPQSTMYVTLEPCAHQGRTPSCARMLVRESIGRVVVASGDIFSKVNGRGIAILTEGGIGVEQGQLADEAYSLNCMFNTAHSLHRPWITLKWAQTDSGVVGSRTRRLLISNPLTRILAHRLRAAHDAILVGSGTVLADHPSLDVRHAPGNSPIPVVLDRRGRLLPDDLACITQDALLVTGLSPLADTLSQLYARGITSVLVEGGPTVLQAFIDDGLYDAVRIESAPDAGTVTDPVFAPRLAGRERLLTTRGVCGNRITWLAASPHITPAHPLVTI